jgi:hypothetical protein
MTASKVKCRKISKTQGVGGIRTRSQTGKPLDIKLVNPNRKVGPVLKDSFIHQGPLLWNDLPDSIQSSNSKSNLKSKLKTYLLNQYPNNLPCKNKLCSDIDNCHHVN